MSENSIPFAQPPVGQVSTAGPGGASAVDPSKVVSSVVESVQSHPDVPPGKAVGVITSILAALYQAEPAVFALSRASGRTQTEVALGLGLAEVIVGAWLRPR